MRWLTLLTTLPPPSRSEKNMYGKKVMGVARTTFIIGPEGKLEHIFEKVKPDEHAEEVLDYLKESAKA